MEKTLEFHETKKIQNCLCISSKKNNTAMPKIKSNIDLMNDSKYPVCKITVEEKP